MAIDRNTIRAGINTSSLRTPARADTKRLASIVGAKSLDTLTVQTGVATTGPSLNLGGKVGLAAVGIGALGAIYWFVIRKPKAGGNLRGCSCR